MTADAIHLTQQQSSAVQRATEHIQRGTAGAFTIGGLAGTGKTTIVKEILASLGERHVAVGAFTGKAVNMLRRKGVERAQTLHSLLYEPVWIEVDACEIANHQCKKRRFRFEPKTEFLYSGVIIDEASMVNHRLLEDLERHGLPLVFIGDHGQLEPIGGDPGLMRHPNVRLEHVHRQARDNPILSFAHHLREGNAPTEYSYFEDDPRLRITDWAKGGSDVPNADIVLCGFNKTRLTVNAYLRGHRGHRGLLEPGERLICLRNDKDQGVFNGSFLDVITVHETHESSAVADVVTDAGTVLDDATLAFTAPGAASRDEIPVDHGYAVTVHKAQGSEWDNAVVLEEVWHGKWDPARWGYTAATRAAKKLTYCVKEPGR